MSRVYDAYLEQLEEELIQAIQYLKVTIEEYYNMLDDDLTNDNVYIAFQEAVGAAIKLKDEETLIELTKLVRPILSETDIDDAMSEFNSVVNYYYGYPEEPENNEN